MMDGSKTEKDILIKPVAKVISATLKQLSVVLFGAHSSTSFLDFCKGNIKQNMYSAKELMCGYF